MNASDPCPCGSTLTYGECCQRCHKGEPAASPEALMRSRYSAFVLGDTGYLQRSWHPDTRPQQPVELDAGQQWVGLRILDCGSRGAQGWVHFQAISREKGGFWVLEEHSRFVLEAGHWFYRDGDHTLNPLKPGRNDACPCGSGRKFKKCCGS